MSIHEMARWILRKALETMSAVEVVLPKWDLLTTRVREVAQLYRQGLEVEDIAKELVISKETMKTHLYNVVRKLGLKKIYELRNVRN